jgi:hypothetical protein
MEIAMWNERKGSYAIVVPMTAATFALATLALRLGPAGMVAGAVIGALWASALGWMTGRLAERWRTMMGGGSIALAIVATGLLVGGGFMYGLVAAAVFREPSTTAAVLSALMQPTIPYFIGVNTVLEALIVPLLVYANWNTPARRRLVVAGAVIYFVMRVWTYLTYAPMRLAIASHPLSSKDIEWYQRTFDMDYRGALNVAFHLCVVLAALASRDRTTRLTSERLAEAAR